MFKSIFFLSILIMLSSCITKEDQKIDPTGRREILELGLKASSSHNAQPWKIVEREVGFYQLYSVQERWLSKVDPNNRELLLSMGALIKNIDLSCKAYGYSFTFDLKATTPFDSYIGDFYIEEVSGTKDKKLLNTIKSIYNSKGLYKKLNLTSEDRELLIKEFSEERLTYIATEDKLFNWLHENSIKANDQQAYRDSVQSELSNYFCYNKEDVNRGIGLTPQMINMPKIMTPIWYAFFNRDSVMKKSFRDGAADKVSSQIQNSGGFLILTSESRSIEDLINCGREYQKLLLKCRELNIEVHPISQLLEEKPWMDNIDSKLGVNGKTEFILRVGYSKKRAVDYNVDVISSASINLPFNVAVEEL